MTEPSLATAPDRIPELRAETPVIEVSDLTFAFGAIDAVKNLSFTVRPGSVYGFFGRNGAGKTTTIKCLLNLLRPPAGSVRLFGLDSSRENDLAIKRRLAYVPDSASFYPWMTVRQVLDYFASFRAHWDTKVEVRLLDHFRLELSQRAAALSKGQTMQLMLACAICASPDLLILDEPTTGLDPVIRREFVEAIIGAYLEADPAQRSVFVSTHLISEFEDLIDDFTIIEKGRTVLSASADEARAKYFRIRARVPGSPPVLNFPWLVESRFRRGELELVVSGPPEAALAQIRSFAAGSLLVENMNLESIFLALLNDRRSETK